MNLGFQRKMDRIVGVFICRLLSLFPKIGKRTYTDLKPQKILIILLSEMGSLVLGWPMLRNIKKEYGNSSVFVLLFEQKYLFYSYQPMASLKNAYERHLRELF